MQIKTLQPYAILDSRGNPTVEVQLIAGDAHRDIIVQASVPSGASTGTWEAVELRDGGERWHGKGVEKAVANIRDEILPRIACMPVTDQQEVDRALIELDGTPNKSRLGANATLGVSLAVAKAGAAMQKMPLYEYVGVLFGNEKPRLLPVPMMNYVNGGAHASNALEFQEFMIVPLGTETFADAMQVGSEIFRELESSIKATGVGDEGGFSPFFSGVNKGKALVREALDLIMDGIERAGYKPGVDVSLALDPAASGFYTKGGYKLGEEILPPKEFVEFYVDLVDRYPIVSIEDGMAEDDEKGWKLITKALGDRIQIVGDDLFVTNRLRLQSGYEKGIANAILIKLNQIGTLSETLETIRLAHSLGYAAVISHRSGETEDTFISDLVVACNAGQIKTGCLSRSERVAKYNRLMRIEQELGRRGRYLGWDTKFGRRSETRKRTVH